MMAMMIAADSKDIEVDGEGAMGDSYPIVP
jgi:hypothetical protein